MNQSINTDSKNSKEPQQKKERNERKKYQMEFLSH